MVSQLLSEDRSIIIKFFLSESEHNFDKCYNSATNIFIFKSTEGSGSFRCHARVDGDPVSPMFVSLDSRLRGNDGLLPEKLPDSLTKTTIFSKSPFTGKSRKEVRKIPI